MNPPPIVFPDSIIEKIEKMLQSLHPNFSANHLLKNGKLLLSIDTNFESRIHVGKIRIDLPYHIKRSNFLYEQELDDYVSTLAKQLDSWIAGGKKEVAKLDATPHPFRYIFFTHSGWSCKVFFQFLDSCTHCDQVTIVDDICVAIQEYLNKASDSDQKALEMQIKRPGPYGVASTHCITLTINCRADCHPRVALSQSKDKTNASLFNQTVVSGEDILEIDWNKITG